MHNVPKIATTVTLQMIVEFACQAVTMKLQTPLQRNAEKPARAVIVALMAVVEEVSLARAEAGATEGIETDYLNEVVCTHLR